MGLSPRLKLVVNYFLGPLLFVIIAFSIYRQVAKQPDLKASLQLIKLSLANGGIAWLVPALLLMLVNWGIEALKWRKLVAVAVPISLSTAFKSVLSGVSFTMLTPNRMGEFLGRVLYLPDGSRMRTAFLTFLGSLSQLSITLFFGIVGLGYFFATRKDLGLPVPNEAFSIMVTGGIGIMLVTLFLLFNIGWLIRVLERVPQLTRYLSYLHLLGTIGRPVLLQLLAFSALRYLVFLLQYWLVFRSIQLAIPIADVFAGAAVLFLMLAIVPSIALAELGIRGKLSLLVFGFFTANTVGILVAATLVWIINIVVPAAFGSLLIFRIRLFQKNGKAIQPAK